MSSTNLIRLGGLAAIIAGFLRGVNSFLPSSLGMTIELLYLLTDIFLLFGMIGLYSFQHQESGRWGFFGFLLAIIGIAAIRTRGIEGINMYAIGALIFAAGLILFAIGSWMANKLPRWVSIFWILSTIIGFIGYFVSGFSSFFAVSGVLFGVGFAGAGLRLWKLHKRN
jgi:hypothetical protein